MVGYGGQWSLPMYTLRTSYTHTQTPDGVVDVLRHPVKLIGNERRRRREKSIVIGN